MVAYFPDTFLSPVLIFQKKRWKIETGELRFHFQPASLNPFSIDRGLVSHLRFSLDTTQVTLVTSSKPSQAIHGSWAISLSLIIETGEVVLLP